MRKISQPPRLVLVASRFQKNDGQGRVNYEVAAELLRRNWPITLLTTHCAEDLSEHPLACAVVVGKDWLPTELLRNLAFASESARWLRKHRHEFDLVQGNGFITWERCDIIAVHFVHTSWAKSPYYPYARSWRPYALYQRLYTTLNSRWERSAFLRARLIIAVSDVVANDIAQLGIPSDRIAVVYNGVDTEEFRPGPSERKLFGLPEAVPMGLFVGDIRSPRKNLETLLFAMLRIPELHLSVAGDPKRSPAPEMTRRLQIEDRVHFLGKSSRIPQLMRSVDLFIFPSRYEAHPLVVLEAMASGLPVVISKNVGSVSVFGRHLVVIEDPDDPVALARAISGLIESPELRAKTGVSAREGALKMCWLNTTEQYIRLYEQLNVVDPVCDR